MKLILVIQVICVLLSSLLNTHKLPLACASDAPLAIEKSTAEPKRIMWASQDTVFYQEDLHLNFSDSHGSCLGVIAPDGHFFYVVFPDQPEYGKLRPLVSSKIFLSLNTLTINTKNLKCDPYIYQVYENKLVFTQSGTYRFLLGDNLHVDDESLLTMLNITYCHFERPLFASQ